MLDWTNVTARAVLALEEIRDELDAEIRGYPTPISGCDAQYNHLIGRRNAVTAAIAALRTPQFVATPRTPFEGAGVESR